MVARSLVRNAVASVVAAATVAALAVVVPGAAGADPIGSATYAATTKADLLKVSAGLAGLTVANAEVGASSATATNAPQAATAAASNLRAAVAGLPLTLQSVTQAAPPDHTTPATQGFDALSAPPLLSTRLIDASAQARAGALGACLPSGSPVSSGSASTAGATVGSGVVPSLTGGVGVGDVADVGAISSTSTTSLVRLTANAKDIRAVRSQAVSNVASLGLLGNAVKVDVSSPATLTADASGTIASSGVTYTAPTVTVTGPDGTPRTLTVQSAITIPIDTRVLGTGLLASVTLTLGTAAGVANSGTSVSATASLLTANVQLSAYVAGVKTATLLSATLAVAPMSVSAAGPASGVPCLNAPPAPVITTPGAGTTTNPTPPISGTGTPGDPVTVTRGGTTVCGPVTVAADGTWTCTPATALPNGPVTIIATETNPAGSSTSDPVTFTVAANAPDAPVITSPVAGSTVTDDTPTITGTGTTGDSVTVTRGGTTICGPVTVTAGIWSCTPGTALPQGPVTIIATESNANGVTDSAPDTFTVTSKAPAAPVITSPPAGSTVTDDTPPISGTGTKGDSVTVTRGGAAVCGPVTVTAGGTWTCTPGTALPQGPVTIVATETNAAGSTDSLPDAFVVTSVKPLAPVITAPTNGSTITDNTPTITGTGTTGDSVTVTRGGTAVCGPVTVTAGGTWTCTPTSALPEGSVTIVATETNAAGSTDSLPDTFTVHSAAPGPPVITSPANGGVVNNGTVAFTGTGIAGDTVTVFESGQPLCSAVVSSAGSWHCSPAGGLTVGVHTVVATQKASSGPVSADSNQVTFTTTIVGTRFVPKAPYRVIDTRSATRVGSFKGPVAKGGSVTLSATQLKIAKGTASAVVLNLTTAVPAGNGYATAYPSDQTRPRVSSVNYTSGHTRANLVIVPVAADGSVTVYTSQSTQLVADVFGYFSTGLIVDSGGLYHAVAPARLLDTRLTKTPLGAGKTRALTVIGTKGVPSSGVASVVLNVTVSHPTALGYISAYPTGTTFKFNTSNVNFHAGDLASTRAIVPVGKNGSVTFYNRAGSTQLVVDVVGYFSAAKSGDATGAQFVAVNPVRVIDSRPPAVNTKAAPLTPGENRVVKLAGSSGVPTVGTVAVVSNLTAVGPTGNGYLTQFQTGTTKALVSDVNYIVGEVVPNLVIGAVNTTGNATVFNNKGGRTDIIEDVAGYFTTLDAD